MLGLPCSILDIPSPLHLLLSLTSPLLRRSRDQTLGLTYVAVQRVHQACLCLRDLFAHAESMAHNRRNDVIRYNASDYTSIEQDPEKRRNSQILLVLYCLRLSFPVFKRSECESFLPIMHSIPADISFVFGKSFGTPA